MFIYYVFVLNILFLFILAGKTMYNFTFMLINTSNMNS